jgi:hypothetical protein
MLVFWGMRGVRGVSSPYYTYEKLLFFLYIYKGGNNSPNSPKNPEIRATSTLVGFYITPL